MINHFREKIELIRRNLDMRGYTIVARECVYLVEHALRQLFTQHLTHLEEKDRLTVQKAELEIGKGIKGIERFTLGELVGIFRKAKVIEAWGRSSGKDLSGIRVIDFNQLTKLRNTFIHEGREATHTEAEFLFNCLQIILETFDLNHTAPVSSDLNNKTASHKPIVSQQLDNPELLQILNTQISPPKLDRLICNLLGQEAVHELKGKTHQDRVSLFLEKIAQTGKEHELAEVIAKLFPKAESRIANHAQPPQDQLVEPAPTPFVPFVNRKLEWEKVVLYPEGSYYLFCGPAGYGKTSLLLKIQQEFERRHWRCSYISLPEQNMYPEVIRKIAQHMQLSSDIPDNEPAKMGEHLGNLIARQNGDHQYEGFALLLDVDHEPWPSLMETLQTMIEAVIPGIYDGLRDSEFFRNTALSYRVVLAGRYIASRIQEFNCYSPYNSTTLTPFDDKVILDICRQNIQDPNEQEAFAPHLLFYSGGHPRCMVHILETFQAAGTTTEKFFHSEQYQMQIKEIAFQEASWVRASIKTPLRKIFDILCFYRRLDYVLLRRLFDEGLIWQEITEDEYELMLKLKGTFLINWTDKTRRHLSDDIVRRMLITRLREDLPPAQFKLFCDQAKDFYLERLKSSPEFHTYWAVEALFEFIQGHVAEIYQETDRQRLRQEFFAQELPRVLHVLLQGCDDPRPEKDSLIGVLEEDWEFRFTLNYYLRKYDNIYDDTPYKEMLQRVETEIATRREATLLRKEKHNYRFNNNNYDAVLRKE